MNAFDEYQYSRKFILSHIRQVRMMVRDGRYVTEGRGLIKKAQADAARRRSRAYGADCLECGMKQPDHNYTQGVLGNCGNFRQKAGA